MKILWLNLLLLVPIIALFMAKRYWPSHRWLITGVFFGIVVAPLSMGLYATFFLPPIGIVTGMIGLVSLLFHDMPGYEFSIYFGFLPSHTVVAGIPNFYIESINAIVWTIVYGFLGWIVDTLLSKRRCQSEQ